MYTEENLTNPTSRDVILEAARLIKNNKNFFWNKL
jgi:hypothetical protein